MVTNAIVKALAIRMVLSKYMNRSLDNDFVARLIKNREWCSFLFLVNTRKDNFNELISNIEENDWSLLILCGESQAPLRIYKAIFKCRPQLFDKRDRNGRFPIHVVCSSGAKHDVIKFFIQSSSKLAISSQDIEGKTPLHLLCEHYLWKSRSVIQPMDKSWKENLSNIVYQLCEKDRSIINIEDHYGLTAIEIAIEHDFPYEVIRFLQRTSAGEWKSSRNLRSLQNDSSTGNFDQTESNWEISNGSDTSIHEKNTRSPVRAIVNGLRSLSFQENVKQKQRQSFQATAA
jgi:hypothetical protein